MRLLTVPNWSFGRDKDLLRIFEDLLTGWDLKVHFLQSDLDHNRTVSAFSGDPELVFERLERLAEAAFERIDLNRHIGVHPRIGALDVCPFIVLEPGAYPLASKIELFAKKLADRFELPIFLYEKSEHGVHQRDLPALRKGGFGSLLARTLEPDFGPNAAHRFLGATVLGERDFLIAMNVNFKGNDLEAVKGIAKAIRRSRDSGDDRFAGVRALGFPLASRNQVQLSLNITQPDLVTPDEMIQWSLQQARGVRLAHAKSELIGVIRRRDLPGSQFLPIHPSQIVD